MVLYSQRHSVINHYNECIILPSDTNISLALYDVSIFSILPYSDHLQLAEDYVTLGDYKVTLWIQKKFENILNRTKDISISGWKMLIIVIYHDMYCNYLYDKEQICPGWFPWPILSL